MQNYNTIPNPDLTVGENNKQRWNQARYRRHGFHNANILFRRALMVRSREILVLRPCETPSISISPDLQGLMSHPAFSALCCIHEDEIVLEASADDFSTTRPHSIQSISKLHVHLIVGRLIEQGVLSLDTKVSDYLPDIGTGYANVPVQRLLDMSVNNNFSEDYFDPNSDCFNEEIALGWRLPGDRSIKETSLEEFTNSITGPEVQRLSLIHI